MRLVWAFLLSYLIGISLQRSTSQDDSYVAAVVEYMVTRNVATNKANYLGLIKEAAEKDADIVIFPELTLTNSLASFDVPINGLLKQYPIPALRPDLYDELLVAMSEAARDNMVYLVINTRESLDCTQPQPAEDCPEQTQYVFNTNVVFDRTGAVIDRYRKINLFGEIGHTPALSPDLGVFTTDFGVTFGHFICFDLQFQVPSIQILRKHDIKDIIFTTMWYSELPYLTAVQIQEAYAYTLDVNFLGSGANNVLAGSAGSGIFSGKAGALVSVMPGLPTNKLLIARVPKVPGNVDTIYPGPIYNNPEDHDNLRMLQDPSMTAHITRPLVEGYQEFTITDKDVICTFRVKLSLRSDTKYQYRAGAFSGVRTYSGVATGGTRICGVFACTGDTKDTCGLRFPSYEDNSTAIFEELTIIGTVPTPVIEADVQADDSIMFPVSVTPSLMPLESKDYFYVKTALENVTQHTFKLGNVSAELYSFALWGRVYKTDGEYVHPPVEDPDIPLPEENASATHTLSFSLALFVLAILLFTQC